MAHQVSLRLLVCVYGNVIAQLLSQCQTETSYNRVPHYHSPHLTRDFREVLGTRIGCNLIALLFGRPRTVEVHAGPTALGQHAPDITCREGVAYSYSHSSSAYHAHPQP